MKKIVTSMIGTGSHAYTWANAIKEDNNFQLKNVSSRTESRGYNFAKHYNCDFVSDVEDISGDNEINLIIITSNPHRNLLAVDFAKKQKNLILEKPLSLDQQESDLIFSECKRNNVICGAGLNRYYDSFFPVVKKYINSLGECYHAEYKQYYKGEKTDQVFSLKRTKETGGLFLGGLVHKFDQANKLFGHPSSLIATEISSTNDNVLLATNVLVKYEDEISFNFSIKNDCSYNFGELMTLYCKNGIIEINFNTLTVSAILNPLNNKFSRAVLSRFKYNLLKKNKIMKFNKKKILYSESFGPGGKKNILENFSKVFYGHQNADLVDIDNNYLSTKMAFACLKSIKQKHWIKL